MKRLNTFITGALFGAVLFSGTTIHANPNTIPTIVSWIKYTFNGQEKGLPEGYTTIIHEGHTYVPARFVAEELGTEVTWNEKSKTVMFEKVDKTEESGQKNDQKDNSSIKYDSLPVSKLLNGVSVEVYDLVQNDDNTQVFLRIKNTNDKPFQLDQESAQLKITDTLLVNPDVPDFLPYKKDKSWYKDITEDMTQEGYVMLPKISDEEIKQGLLQFDVIENDASQTKTTFKFNIKW